MQTAALSWDVAFQHAAWDLHFAERADAAELLLGFEDVVTDAEVFLPAAAHLTSFHHTRDARLDGVVGNSVT